MVKIVKDNIRKEVTKGAYKNFYEPLGYKIEKSFKEGVEEKPRLSKEDKADKVDKTDENNETENTYKKR